MSEYEPYGIYKSEGGYEYMYLPASDLPRKDGYPNRDWIDLFYVCPHGEDSRRPKPDGEMTLVRTSNPTPEGKNDES